MASLRNQTVFSLGELREATRPLLATLNERPQVGRGRVHWPMCYLRSNRNTAAAFRWALHRFGRAFGLPRLLAWSCSSDLRDIQCSLSLGPRDVG